MKLRRGLEPSPLDPEFVDAVAQLYTSFTIQLRLCRSLTERIATAELTDAERGRALAAASDLALLELVVTDKLGDSVPWDAVPDGFLPNGVHGAVGRLSYALILLAEANPDPRTLLRPEELDGLAGQYAIEDWLELFARAARERAESAGAT